EPVQIIEMDIRDAVKLIRGPKGTKVILTVRRAGKGTFKIEIIRDKIDVKDRAAKITYEKRKIGGKEQLVGVLNLPSYYGGDGGRSSYEDVKALLEEAKQKKVDALVLDLSQNGGGLLSEAVRISGLFLRSGAIVATQSFDGETEVLNDEDTETTYSGPLVVLISQASASAAEISAGALQDYRRAVIAGGKNSFGKGTVQQLSGLPGGRGAIKLTTGMFFLPSGLSTQQRGVPAHILIPNVFDGSDRGEKDLDFSLSPTRTPPFVSSTANDRNPTFHWQPVSENITKTLAAKSKARVAKDKNLQDIVSQTKEREERPTRLSLKEIREEADKEDRDGEDAKAEFERKSKAFVDEGVNIAADLASLNPKVKAALR
ncbi:MAG: S41 family peptidase, partial [Myxococcota bacterium]